MTNEPGSGYGLSDIVSQESVPAPQLNYLPPSPKSYRPSIGLIGAGGISEYHLSAYQRMGLDVAVICDLDRDRAEKRRQEWYPNAKTTTSYEEALRVPGVEVIDVATHPSDRVAIIEAAIQARKHVLSQKPFVTDLDVGLRLADLADRHGVQLAVNQNGRWAPHWRYIHQFIRGGYLGPLSSVDCVLHWDHTWTEKTPFNDIHHLVLLDFAIHWFDIISSFFAPQTARSVYALVSRTSFQTAKPPFLATVAIDYGTAQARLSFNAHVRLGQEDRTIVAGRDGIIRACGPNINEQEIHLATAAGEATRQLRGRWFDDGFAGTMGELLCAIEERRTPENNARDNLTSLALCFAALASADEGSPMVPGAHRQALP